MIFLFMAPRTRFLNSTAEQAPWPEGSCGHVGGSTALRNRLARRRPFRSILVPEVPMLQKRIDGLNDEMQANGEEEDRREGAARYLTRLLEGKFGPLDEESRRLVEAADFERLILLTDRMLDAHSVQDVFND